MNFFSKNNALTIGLVAIVLAGVAYLVFFTGEDDVPTLTQSAAAGSPEELYFVSLASELSNIRFDTAVLDDDRFKALVDLETPIQDEPMGRDDPFAPY